MFINRKNIAFDLVNRLSKPRRGLLSLLPTNIYREHVASKLRFFQECLFSIKELKSFYSFDSLAGKDKEVTDAEKVMVRRAQFLAAQIVALPKDMHQDLLNFIESNDPEIHLYVLPAYSILALD